MLWKVMQASVFVFFVGGNIAWQWTPNGLLATLTGLFFAALLTAVISDLLTLCRRLK